MTRNLTPLGAIARGALAGGLGTLAMDLLWYRRHREGGGQDSFLEWEFSSGTTGYDSAPAPAQVGRRLVEAFLQRELPDETAVTMNNVVHWSTGMMWGVLHAVLFASLRSLLQPLAGLAAGVTAWVTSYVTLAQAGIYRPMREYDRQTLWKDLSAHLVFGSVLGTVFSLSRGRKR